MDTDKKHILLVEDDAIISMAQVVAIKKFGYAVSSAYSGEKAVLMAVEDPSIDLILMDIDLGPGMNGPEAAQRILETRNLPIVFLTSHSEASYVDLVQKITRYGYVVKNSGDFVLRSSIETAFTLFESNTRLRESEAFYRHLFHTHPDPTFLISQDALILDMNDAACADTGRKREESVGLSVGDVDPNYPTDQFLAFWEPKSVGTSYSFESLHAKKDGAAHPVQIHGSKFMIHDKTYYYGVAHDLSAVKSAQRMTEHTKAILVNLREINQLIIQELSPRLFAQGAVEALCSNVGYTSAWIALLDADGIIRQGAHYGLGEDGASFIESMKGGYLPPCLNRLDRDNPAIRVEDPKDSCRACGRINSYQGQSAYSGLLMYRDTLYGYMSVSVSAEFAYREEGLELFGEIRQDLAFGLYHARERAELIQNSMDLRKALAGTEDLHRSIIEHTTMAILCADDTGQYISANQAAADMFGYPVERLLTMRVSDLRSADETDTGEQYRQYVEKGYGSGEFAFLRADGQARIAEYQAVRVGPDRHVSMLVDATDRKHDEAKIRTLLKEKELRLTEVQHRIKNNLNTVASLLTLQADEADHPLVRQALFESVGRVRSISLLYDQMYNPGDGKLLPSSPYLENLSRSVVSLFPHASEVELTLSVEPLVLDKQLLSSVGIVANEFITNAMKHAFRGPGPHRLKLDLAYANGRLLLKVSDSGCGKGGACDSPPSPHSGIGNTIVSALAQQLGGTVSCVNEGGCTALLDIPWSGPDAE